jgi:hypothetical protein
LMILDNRWSALRAFSSKLMGSSGYFTLTRNNKPLSNSSLNGK